MNSEKFRGVLTKDINNADIINNQENNGIIFH